MQVLVFPYFLYTTITANFCGIHKRKLKMQNVLTVDAKNAIDIRVNYSNTTLTHWFYIGGINALNVNALKQHLWNANLGNGDISLYVEAIEYMQLCYETTDIYEFSENFAYKLANAIDNSVCEFIRKINNE